MSSTVEVGQIRQHQSGLTLKVLRRERGRAWAVKYLPPDVPPKGKNERIYDEASLLSYYPEVGA